MTPSPDPALRTSVVVVTGQLRECVAAARNLEHLVASLTVGPQVLAQVIPDVAQVLDEYPKVLNAAIECCNRCGIETSEPQRAALAGSSKQRVSELSALLKDLGGGPVHARSRLSLERKLTQVVPILVTAVAHVELLLDICQAEPAEMSVGELLTSMPERGSDRPHRPLAVAGSGLETMVSISPRVALKLLSAWVSCAPGGDSSDLVLMVEALDGRVEFKAEVGGEADLMVRLPVFFPSPRTLLVLSAALRRLNGHIDGSSLIFPAQV